jgi:hypothetical protein
MSTNSSSRQQLIMEQQQQSVNRAMDITKDSLLKATEEQIRQNSRLANTFKDMQQLSVEVAGEIVDNSLEVQRAYMNVIRQASCSQIENASPKRLAETYSKMIGAYTDNTIAFYRLFNDVVVANLGTYLLSSIKQTSNYAKGVSEIGSNVAKNIQTITSIGAP